MFHVVSRERRKGRQGRNIMHYESSPRIIFFSFRSRQTLYLNIRLPFAALLRKGEKQMLSQRVFLVTGANRGIGFEVVKKLAANHPDGLVLLGSRNLKRGEEALAQLGSPSNVKVLLIDTSSKESIEQAKEEIQKKYDGHLDVLINNAGVAINGTSLQVLKDIFNTNFYGVKYINDTMSSLLRDNGRIVNVSSNAAVASIQHCSQDLKTKFLDPNLTETELVELFSP